MLQVSLSDVLVFIFKLRLCFISLILSLLILSLNCVLLNCLFVQFLSVILVKVVTLISILFDRQQNFTLIEVESSNFFLSEFVV